MRILIADDHAIFRRGLKDILSERFPSASFGEADTARDALELVWKKSWDLVVLDISMPGRSGVEILKEIKQTQPKLPVLVLSAHPEDQYSIRVFEDGAAGYVTKMKAPTELVEAVEKVLRGGKYISAATAEKLLERVRGNPGGVSHQHLSNREFEILRLFAAGKSSKEIAAMMSLSPQTVSTYRARILKKLSLHSTSELIRYAIDHRLMQ